jgi:DNA-binding CsgD family transcriptional regulator
METKLQDEKERATQEAGGACNARLTEIERRLDLIEDAMARAMSIGLRGGGLPPPPLPPMTTRQHATLQMLMRGAGNREIAERLGVTVNTAKVHVRGLFAKFGVNTRAGIVVRASPTLERIDNAAYMLASGGLPVDWDRKFEAGREDPYAPLYRSE